VSDQLNFFVPGIPVPGGSKRAFMMHRKGCPAGRKHNPGACHCRPFTTVVDAAGQANKDWRTAVVKFAYEAAHEYGGILPMFSAAISVEFTFWLPRPKGHYNAKGQLLPSAPEYPTTRPDVLKLARAVEDALTGIIWTDDSLIVHEILEKDYASRTNVSGLLAQIKLMASSQEIIRLADATGKMI